MRALLLQKPLLTIALGYIPALGGAWWLLSEALAGRYFGPLLVAVALGAFFLGFRTGIDAQPAPEAADAADPMPQPAAPAVQGRPAVGRLGAANSA
jgi:hypothetical protein